MLLLFWGVLLVFHGYSRVYYFFTTVTGCSAVLPLFPVLLLCSAISWFYSRVSHSGGDGGMGSTPRSYDFLWNPPSSKPMPPPHGAHPPLKNEVPNLKTTSPPLKSEATFLEMIPRKSTINNNLKSS